MQRTVALHHVVALCLLAVLGAPLAAQTIPEILRRERVQPIDPPSPASDFRLPRLEGGEGALSDYYGRWVVLTFFATWCGPCRSELPTLEKLHQDRADAGLVVLGVSIDDTRAPLDPFVRKLALSFPVLWDQNKAAATAYRASSIPLTYLVDPQGRLVGVSRGSRDWSALTPMLDAALAVQPPEGGAAPLEGAYADPAEAVATPTVTDPPTADVALARPGPVRVGESFELIIRLHWAGSFEEYLPQPPRVELPEGVVQEGVTAETDSVAGRSEVVYRLRLRADAPGSYALDPVELRYMPRLESQPVAGRVLGPVVEVVELKVLGMAPGLAAGVGVGGSAALALLGFAFARLRRARTPRVDVGAELTTRLDAAYEAARERRLAGDGGGVVERLGELDALLRGAGEDGVLGAEGAAAVEQARYGGQAPPREELDALLRRVERRLAERREHGAKRERAELAKALKSTSE